MQELVFKSAKGNPVTTSLIVANIFNKAHKHVLRDIDELSCSDEFRQSNFGLSSYRSSQNKKLPMYIMTEDGFSFLVMGYTGEKAGEFKEKFIAAFNSMKSVLSAMSPVNLTKLQILEMAIESEKKVIALEKENKILSPKADYADRVLESDNQLVDIGQASKLLKLPFGRNSFFKRLREDGIFFKNRNEPKQEFIERGYFDVRKSSIERNEHPDFTVIKVLVSPKGLFWLSKKYGGNSYTSIPVLNLQ